MSTLPDNQSIRKTRGPINKRACQRCRQGKIKCDGNAETGHPCSNCEPNTCKYDNSPRKNKQVEALKHRMGDIEDKLVQQKAATENLKKQNVTLEEAVEIKQFEKEVLKQLILNKSFFQNYDPLFNNLLTVIMESRCYISLLQLIKEHLVRLPLPDHQNRTSDIMQALDNLSRSALNCDVNSNFGPQTPAHLEIHQRINNYLNTYDQSATITVPSSISPNHSPLSTHPATTPILTLSTSFNQSMDHLTSPSQGLVGFNNLSINSPSGSDNSYYATGTSPATTINEEDQKYYTEDPAPELLSASLASGAFPGYFPVNEPYSWETATTGPFTNALQFQGVIDPDVFLNSAEQMEEEYYSMANH